MATSDEARLWSIASSISDGEAVNWTDVAVAQSGDTPSNVLGEMAVLDQIASFYRSVQSVDTPLSRNDDGVLEDPQTWGHFTILGRIGGGASGTVYRARDTKLQSDVALKLLWPASQAPTGGVVTLKEARLLARVRHENVVRVLGTDAIDGRVGIWMEFVRGRTLADQLREHGPFSAREAANIGVDLCRALAAVHRAGLLHGDVKAQNVMREEGGRTVLTDFGTGKDLEVKTAGGRRAADFAGTPLYLAPEVFDGHPRTKSADIYSLGVLLYQLVTNTFPVEGSTRAEVAEAHQRRDRKYLRDVRPDLPADFVAVVERSLATDPRERYQSAGAFEAALAQISGRKAEAGHLLRWPRWMPVAVGVAVTVTLAVGLTVWIFSPAARDQSLALAVRDGVAGRDAPAGHSAVTDGTEYQIETALYRVRGAEEERLRPGRPVQPGDELFAKVRVSVPAYVYIVNEDDLGVSFVLFPLPGQEVAPLSAGTAHRVPGAVAGEQVNWQVTSAGGREHFLIFASPERLTAFEQILAKVPRPEFGKPVQYARLSSEAVGRLRGIGGLTPSPAVSSGTLLATQYTTPLADTAERVRGLWVRQFTVENPQ